jgi:glycosyltransferase involved in cell wall biosynthesis
LKEAFPRIQKQIPYASLTIVGRSPSAPLSAAAAKFSSVTLTGRVEDVRPYLAEAEVVVVPLRVGGGTRIKIPEAMAMSKAVVSTRIGAEGLPFDNRREILLEDEPERFAESVVDLLKNTEFRSTVGNAARERVVRDHSWQSVVDQLERTLLRLTGDQNSLVDAIPSRSMANFPEA